MNDVFSTFFAIGASLSLSLFLFGVLPSYFLLKKLKRG